MILVGSDGERIDLGTESTPSGGVLVPLEGPPGKDSTVPGPPGRNVDGITLSGDNLVFDMSQGADITVAVPAITEATEAAGRAEDAASLSVQTAAGIQDVAEDAAQVALDRQAVESAALTVATDRQAVTDARGVVVTAKEDVEQIQTDVHETKSSIENTANLVDQTLEQYGAQFVEERELSQQAVTNATLQAQRAEDAADGIIAGAVLDDSITTLKLVDEAVTKPKTSPAVQASLDKADGAVQGDDPRLTDARPPTTHTHAEGQVTGLTAKLATKADLDGNGKVLAAQLPAEAMTDFLGAVTSQSSMLALIGQRGDWCTRDDLGTDWQLIAEPSSTLANWREKTYPASPVSSVNGRTGAVDTSSADITDATTVGRNVLKAADAAVARSVIGAGTGNSNLELGTTSSTAMRGDGIQAVASLPGSPVSGILYCIPE